MKTLSIFAAVGAGFGFIYWLFYGWLVGAANDYAMYSRFAPVMWNRLFAWSLGGAVGGLIIGAIIYLPHKLEK